MKYRYSHENTRGDMNASLFRHNIPDEVRTVISIAFTVEILGPIEIVQLTLNHGDDWDGMIAEMSEYLEVDRYRAPKACTRVRWAIEQYYRKKIPEGFMKGEKINQGEKA